MIGCKRSTTKLSAPQRALRLSQLLITAVVEMSTKTHRKRYQAAIYAREI